jgi:hypothetical protein
VIAPSLNSATSANAGISARYASHSSYESHVWSKPRHALQTIAIRSGPP